MINIQSEHNTEHTIAGAGEHLDKSDVTGQMAYLSFTYVLYPSLYKR